jgi:hypothetical protein
VDQELLLRDEDLAAENRILKAQLRRRLRLSDAEGVTLGEIGHRLGRSCGRDKFWRGPGHRHGVATDGLDLIHDIVTSHDIDGFEPERSWIGVSVLPTLELALF